MTTTHIVLITVFVMLLIYTAMAGKIGVLTISRVMRDSAWNWSIVPYIIGLLAGHWLINTNHPLLNEFGWGYGLPVMGLLVAKDVYRKIKGITLRQTYQHPAWYLTGGLVSGYLFWSLIY